MAPIRTYRLLVGLLALVPSFAFAQPCLVSYTFTASPMPVGGQYQAGETVTFCCTITNWNTSNANWFHGLTPQLGAGWDASTMIPGPPPATQGTSTGTWGWYTTCTGTSGVSIGTVGPGYFFDLDNDGNPGNNFGDYVQGASNFQFCWTISVATGAACVNGADLSMTAMITGDSETGSWGSSGCTGDPNPLLAATAQCCAADPGLPSTPAFCDNDPAVDLFTLLGGTPDVIGTWTDPNGAAFTNPFNPATGLPGVYTYTVPDVLPCLDAQATVTVTVNPLVDAGLDATTPLCMDAAPVNLFGELGGTPDATGFWLDPNNAPFSGTFDVNVHSPGIYTYVMPTGAPCVPDTSRVTVTVDPLPVAGNDASLVLCADGPVTDLFALLGGTPDVGGIWSDPNGATHSGTLDPSLELSGPYRYVTIGVGACNALSDTAYVDVTIDPLPVVSFTASPMAGCDPLLVDFANTTPPSAVGSVLWTFGDGSSDTFPPSTSNTYQNPGQYTVTLRVTSPAGCVDQLTVPDMITVTPQPLALFTTDPNPTTVENSTVFMEALDPAASIWNWTITDFGSGLVLGTSTDQSFPFEFPNTLGGFYDVCLEVQDQFGCQDEECQVVVVKNPLLVFVPNAFSPDGDGINDLFIPSIVGNDERIHVFQVFDRWGEMIYETNNMQRGWDGRYREGGEILPTGVYVWKLRTKYEGSADREEYIGSVTLLK